MDLHPPKPRLAFRVGIVGHRPARLTGADPPLLARRVGGILLGIRAHVESFHEANARLFAAGAPVLRAVSSLAEGSDRLFADAALDAGYELCCPMPFAQSSFEDDFRPPAAQEEHALEAFTRILDRAARETRLVRFEMNGDRARAAEAYGACGRVVLNQSDLLVAVWDGERLDRPGGTEAMLDEARQKGVPIVWVDARAPHGWQIVAARARFDVRAGVDRATPERVEDAAALADAVRLALALPQSDASASAHLKRAPKAITIDDFYAERRPLRNQVPAAARGSGAALATHAHTVDRLRPFQAWPDRLAVRYASLYRSAFVVAYALAGAAVGTALLPLALGWDVFEPHRSEAVFIAAELAAIAAILAIVWRGRRGSWHERWMDYRLAAELVRHVRLLAPLGGDRPFPQVPAQWAGYGDPGSTWMAWYARAVERDLGLPQTTMNAAYVRTCVADLAQMIGEQIAYHRRNANRHHRLENRLHLGAMGLLAVTLVACGIHLTFSLLSSAAWPSWTVGSLVFLAGFLPAVCAGLAGISSQAELRRVAKRSAAMESRLQEMGQAAAGLMDRLDGVPADSALPGLSAEATDLARQTAHLMVNEVLDWRVVFLDQPLKPA